MALDHKRMNERVPESLRAALIQGDYPRGKARKLGIQEVIHGFRTEKILTRASVITTLGSCFAQELRIWLAKHGYNSPQTDVGIVYTPRNIRQILQWSLEPSTWNPHQRYYIVNNRYFDPYRKSEVKYFPGQLFLGPVYLGDSQEVADAALAEHYQRNGDLLRSVDVLVITLGLTELWQHKTDKAALFAMPSAAEYDPEQHEFYNLSYDEVAAELDAIVALLARNNPKARVLLTVSPIPLSNTMRLELGPVIATAFSKSVLHAAAYAALEKYRNVYYMPSYEIVRSRPEKWYKDDGRHVTQKCIDKIMETFRDLYVADE